MRESAKEGRLNAILLGAMLVAAAPVAADEVTDSGVTPWVNEALRLVTLSGRVDNLAAKDRVDGSVTIQGEVASWSEAEEAALLASAAVHVAGRVRAVREVVNEIRVQPATGANTRHSDAALAKAIRESFRRHWTTPRVADRIRVGVEDGVATLTGDLDTWDERLEAGSVALGTEGVWKIQNRLTVKGYDYGWEERENEAPYYYEELFPNVA